MKFFFPIRTGTLQRERARIAAKRGHHLRRVDDLDAQIAALQNERNEHFAAASAYTDAETTLDLQDAALTLDEPNTPLLGGIDREAHPYWRNRDYREPGEGATVDSSTTAKGSRPRNHADMERYDGIN